MAVAWWIPAPEIASRTAAARACWCSECRSASRLASRRDQGMPGRLRPELGASAKEPDRVTEGAAAGRVFPAEPVHLLQLQPPAVAEQVAVGGSQFTRL